MNVVRAKAHSPAALMEPGRPLTLGVGRHHISVQAPGYRPLDFDVNIAPGQVLPYRGDLAPF